MITVLLSIAFIGILTLSIVIGLPVIMTWVEQEEKENKK